MKKLKKILLWIAGVLAVLALLMYFVVGPYMKSQTKKHSPEQNIVYAQGDLELKTFYCSPSKKGRDIFGALIPYGEVWRTGANEASTFTTNKSLLIQGQILKAGTYSLWTIPGAENWSIIFNDKMYGWGVKVTDQKAAREAEFDVVIAEVPVTKSASITESFTISFAEAPSEAVTMTIAWDDVMVSLPMMAN